MKSPFPGMDPYLERHWLDVHTSLVSGARDLLNQMLPDDLVARAEERVAIESDIGDPRSIGPDIRDFSPASADVSGTGLAVDAPFKLVLDDEPITERFIRILDTEGTLIAVIEFISPTNKRGQGLEAYLEKRTELLHAGIAMLEIDLARQGDWRRLMRPHRCPPKAESTYRTTVREPPGRTAYLYPMPLRLPLPEVHVPLRQQDPRVMLPLQQLIEQVYSGGRYARTLDYSRACEPELTPEEAAWAEELLRGRE